MPGPIHNLWPVFLARRTKECQGELTLTQTVRAEGNDSLGTRGAVVLLIKPNQIKPLPLLKRVRIGELRSVRSGVAAADWVWAAGLLRILQSDTRGAK